MQLNSFVHRLASSFTTHPLIVENTTARLSFSCDGRWLSFRTNFLFSLWVAILQPGSWFNIKMLFYQYGKSHRGEKMFIWLLYYLHNGNSFTSKTSLYCISPLEIACWAEGDRTIMHEKQRCGNDIQNGPISKSHKCGRSWASGGPEQTTKSAICFWTWNVIHVHTDAPYTRIVEFWHINDMPS